MKFNDAQYWQNIACIVWYYINAVVKPFSMYRFFYLFYPNTGKFSKLDLFIHVHQESDLKIYYTLNFCEFSLALMLEGKDKEGAYCRNDPVNGKFI